MRRVVRARMGSADSEDVVQDILISLHASRHSFEPERPFLPWLMAIIRFGIADHLSKRTRTQRLETAYAEVIEPSIPPLFDHRLEAREFVRKGLARLPASQRMALELTKLRQLSLEEASVESGMSISALKVAAHRGLRALQTKWAISGMVTRNRTSAWNLSFRVSP